MISDFDKIKTVFESCKNYQQFEVAKKMLACYFDKYRDEFDSISKHRTMLQIQKIMDDCVARIKL